MIRAKETKTFAKSLITRFRDDDVPSLGAQLTYYLILSFFPFLIFLVTLLGFFSLSGDSIVHQFIRLLPTDSGQAVESVLQEVNQHRSGALLSFGMLGTIWAASNGVNAIIKGLNKAYDEEETRPFWKVRAISVASTLVLAVVILSAMLLLIFGKVIEKYIAHFLFLSDAFHMIWSILQFAVPLAAMFGVFLLLYRLTPDRRLSWREVIPGSVFATFGWIASSLLFSLYVNHFGNYSKTYGSIGGIIVLLLWLYWSSIIIVLGGEINATLAFGKEGKQKRPFKNYGHVVPLFRHRSRVSRS
ncbi:YihY/virulence factor BrkB family protein [Cohnella pontilimi]|uniref:YihY/virulence factor BrkB family protein n=1 Tax=Cohnella pontilimi TaxID=2564100 RepID=A0A4U0FA04_9BACL|nr:YihY/virulence factor BrkB family protein [Cohnella pontilimi]TJY41471.1 YihY/virulence factor BrkB family protein [Cohnella pontilimi]